MKRYRLVKDLPTFKAGDEFVLKDDGNLYLADLPGKGSCHWKGNVMAYHRNTLAHFPNILVEWFEEIEDSGSWKPKRGDEYYWIGIIGGVAYDVWRGGEEDEQMYAFGNCFRTREDAERAKEKLKAWKRLKDAGLKIDAENVSDVQSLKDGYVDFDLHCYFKRYNGFGEDMDTLFGGGE